MLLTQILPLRGEGTSLLDESLPGRFGGGARLPRVAGVLTPRRQLGKGMERRTRKGVFPDACALP